MFVRPSHWHLSDDQTFPVLTQSYPGLALKSAFAPTAVYNLSDLAEIVSFAAARGVRVLPELETPGHGECRSRMMPMPLPMGRSISYCLLVWQGLFLILTSQHAQEF